MRKNPALFLALAIAAAIATSAGAQVVLLDQWASPPSAALGGHLSDTNVGEFAADDFVTATTVVVDQLDFRGVYFSPVAPQNPVPFLINFRQDSGGLPGAIVAAVVPTISQVQLASSVAFSLYVFTATFPPVALPAGFHWVEIRETHSDPSIFFRWEFADATDPVHGRAGVAVKPASSADFGASPGALSLRVRGLVTPVELLDFAVD